MTKSNRAQQPRDAATRLRRIVESLPVAAAFIESERLLLNPAAERLTGYRSAELPTLAAWFSALFGDRAQEIQTLYRRQRENGFPEVITLPLLHRDGSTRWVQFSGIRDGAEEAWLLHNITGRRVAEQALRESEERYALAMQGSQDGLWDWDIRTGEVYFSDRWKRMIGYAPEELANHVDTWEALLHPDDKERVFGILNAYFAQSVPVYEVEFRCRHRNGSYCWILARGVALFDSEGKPYRMAGSHTDITARKEAEIALEAQKRELEQALTGMAAANARLETLATTDGLTGLTNHRAFQERLSEVFAQSRRSHRAFSVALLDVDRFKQYNDAFGHQAGDAVLQQVAEILRRNVREYDVAARYGGEEFVVLLPETGAEEAREIGERLRLAVQVAPWSRRAVTVSVGLATRGAETELGSETVAAADKALYRSKQQGRNRVTHADELDAELWGGDPALAPYTALFQEMLQAQQDSLLSASERMRTALAQTYDATIESWARLLDLRDKETEGHSERVTKMTVRLCESIGMNSEEIMYARWGALLHDIGKMGVPDQILLKPAPLTESEWVLMRQHTTLAYELLYPIEFLRPAIDIPYCHHEKWDGSGYPRGLKGDEIPLTARLFAVIDVYDALRADRPYRQGWAEERVRAYLQEQAGTHFDPRAVRVFLKMLNAQDAERNAAQRRAA